MRLRLAALALIALLSAPGAAAQDGYDTEPTREQWVEWADAICERPYDRAVKRLKRIGPLTKRGRYGAAGNILIAVARVVFDVNERVAALPRPPADADAIAAYLRGERAGARFALVRARR